MKIPNFKLQISNKYQISNLIKRIKGNKKLSIFLAVFTFLVLVGLIGIVLPALAVVNQAKSVEKKARETKKVLATKDLTLIKNKLLETSAEVEKLNKKYHRLILLKFLPGLHNYYFDGQRAISAAKAGVDAGKIVTEAIEPYQDFLGFKEASESSQLTSGAKTTEERINFLVESFQGIKPRLDEIEKELDTIKQNVELIRAERYPENFRGQKLREKIVKGKENLAEINDFIKEGRPLIEQIDWLLGKNEPRHYLFLFQNDGELRPTGGFWTAYGILKVDNGKITPLISEDIYALDARFDSTIPVPRPIKKYHKKVYYWHLRDMNLSPDFKKSVEEFTQHYKTIKGNRQFDAVIAIDTQVLVDILKVLGRIGVPGWGNFSPEPDDRCWGCPQVVYHLELLADKPVATTRANRKGFLAPLMHSIIANALGSPKEQVASLTNVVFENLKSKHVLVYFPDETLEGAAESLKIAGRIDSFEGDYFHLNDANFAGAKSNLFITQEVKQDFKFGKDNQVTKKVTVAYKNSAPASDCNLERGGLCLNGLYRNWFRFYVPAGSKLIKMTGSEVEPVIYEELGKTVFEGFYGNKYPLYPQSGTRVSIEYELPPRINKKGLKMLIQKQPGTKAPQYEVLVNGQSKKKFALTTDRTLVIGP